MGNVNGREDGDIGRDDRSPPEPGLRGNFAPDSRAPARASSFDSVGGCRPQTSSQSRLPILSVPQVSAFPFSLLFVAISSFEFVVSVCLHRMRVRLHACAGTSFYTIGFLWSFCFG